MILREFQKSDQKAVEEIFALYWTDQEFLKELSEELGLYIANRGSNSAFFVADENNEIVGVVGLKKLPEFLKSYAMTSNPAEFYVIAAKYKRRGIGEKLKLRLIEEAQRRGFSEILLYSPGSHDESWNFHDKFGFERVGEVTPPEDGVGQLWRKIL